MLITSFFVVTVTNMLTFTTNEDRAYKLLMNLHYKQQLTCDSINVIHAAYILRNAKGKGNHES
jgi:hypothetical protein